MAERLKQAQPQQLRVVVVVHQPAAEVDPRDQHNQLRGHAAALQAWASAGADLLLGGHIHKLYRHELLRGCGKRHDLAASDLTHAWSFTPEYSA